MKTLRILSVVVIAISLFHTGILFSADKEKEFEAIGKMRGPELAAKAKAVLEKKYPNENWQKYNFPKFVYIKDEVTVGYKIAVKEPELLAKFPCYCFCEAMGHKNLSYCFLKKGTVREGFDPHAAGCNTCTAEAMMAFLWNDLGIELPKMQQAMKQIFEHK